MMEILRIPKKRLKKVLSASEEIRKHYSVDIRRGEDDELILEGDGASVYFSKDVVLAIGRGFEPEDAYKLFNQDNGLYIVDLREHTTTRNSLIRIKGRIIGEKGRTKIAIEQATDTKLAIFGHTVGIIGPKENIEYAKEAISMLISGARHSTVYKFLARVREKILADYVLK